MSTKKCNFTVSVVIPAYNEAGNIDKLMEQIFDVLQEYGDYEILFVDDGSEDGTLEVIKNLSRGDSRIHYISLTRNFGHQNALKAGLDYARGDCVITIDADLQHPPSLIPQLVEKWQEGYDIVYTIRRNDPKLSLIKRKTAALFYKVMNIISDIKIQPGTADFRLLDRKVVDVLKNFREYHLFFRGLTPWIGFKQFSLSYSPADRFSGTTKYTLKKMMGFAFTGITSFSLKPLKLSIFAGLALASVSFLYAIYAIVMKAFTQQTVPGWTSVLVSVLFIGGIQLIMLGIVGGYLGKLFMESKGRPHYIIKESSKLHE